jgi:hypothetical protein
MLLSVERLNCGSLCFLHTKKVRKKCPRRETSVHVRDRPKVPKLMQPTQFSSVCNSSAVLPLTHAHRLSRTDPEALSGAGLVDYRRHGNEAAFQAQWRVPGTVLCKQSIIGTGGCHDKIVGYQSRNCNRRPAARRPTGCCQDAIRVEYGPCRKPSRSVLCNGFLGFSLGKLG